MAIRLLGKARSGTREWLFQRVANLAICVWAVVFIGLVLSIDTASFANWQSLFAPIWFKVYSSISLLLVCLNSVLAGWQIGTDYLKPVVINRLFMGLVIVGSVVYSILGMAILWGI